MSRLNYSQKKAFIFPALMLDIILAVGLALALTPLNAQSGEIVTYILTDHLGSPVIEMNGAGQVIKREVYGPYGQAQISPNNSGIGYTGHMHDGDTGLTYMQARYFDPEAIRFLSPDPVRFSPGHPNHFNPYWYAEGNPYKYTDPDGRNITTAFGGVLYESAQFVQGNGFDGQSVMGALADGYNGQGAGFAASLGEDVLNFVPAGAAVKVVRVVGNLIKEAKVVNTVAKSSAELTRSAEKGIQSLEKRISEHEKKLADFKANPTVRPGMERQSESVIKAAQESRVQHLEKEIQTFKNNIEKLKEKQ